MILKEKQVVYIYYIKKAYVSNMSVCGYRHGVSQIGTMSKVSYGENQLLG